MCDLHTALAHGDLATLRLTRHSARGIPKFVNYEPLLNIVLDSPEIPYNAGNIGRTCVAAGCKMWLVKPLGFQINDYYLRRAGVDYWPHLEWEVVEDWPSLQARLAGKTFYYFSKTARKSYADVAYQPGDALVFGSESRGLSPELLAANAAHAIRLPMRPVMRSLNVSNAAAIVVYEAWRQWQVRGLPLAGDYSFS